MTQPPICPQCQSPLPVGASEGLCPKCLLRVGLQTNTVVESTAAVGDWTPPAEAELAERFPELDEFKFIGRGGMGAVFKARQKNLDRVVALKILPPEIGRDPAFAERFAREAQAMARLSHPHIVTIHDFGQRGDLFFFLMEYVDGLNLRQLLSAGSISTKEALAIVPQICDALQYAHDQGIVHRDIKPENILLSRTGNVKIADFGLAKLMGRASNAAAPERVMGTPAYMAPEQTAHPAEVDHRADIYALGVVFYQMLTGELPKEKLEPPSRKVIIDVRLDEVVLRALEKEPQRRYQHVSDVKTELETIAGSPSPQISAATFASTTSPAAKPRLSRLAIVGLLWAAEALLIFLWLCAITGERVPPLNQMSSAELLGFWITQAGGILGALAIPGTTLLGCIALFKIRRSRGLIFGLRLALFDALLFPLLALDGLIVMFTARAMRTATRTTSAGVDLVDIHYYLRPILLTALACGVINVVLVRWAWRVANRAPDGSLLVPPRPQSAGRSAKRILILGGVMAAGAFVTITGLQYHYTGQQTHISNEPDTWDGSLEIAIGQELEHSGLSSSSTIYRKSLTNNDETGFFTDLKSTLPINGRTVRQPLTGQLNVQYLGAGQWAIAGDQQLKSLRFDVQTPTFPADAFDISPYPAVDVTLGWSGDIVRFPRPELILPAVRTLPEYQDWLRVGDDHTFAVTNSSGYRFEVHFIGLAATPPGATPQELIADVELFRPNGNLLAVARLGTAQPALWDTDVFDAHGAKTASLQWRAVGAIEHATLSFILQNPNTSAEDKWLVNSSRVVYSNHDHHLPEDFIPRALPVFPPDLINPATPPASVPYVEPIHNK